MEKKNDLQLLVSQKTVLNQSLRFSLKLFEMGSLELKEFINNAALENPFLEIQDGVCEENVDDLEYPGFSTGSDSCSNLNHHGTPISQISRFTEKYFDSFHNSFSDHGRNIFSEQIFWVNNSNQNDDFLSNVAAPSNNKAEFLKNLAFFRFNSQQISISELLYDCILDHRYLSGEFLKSISEQHKIPYSDLLFIIKKLQTIPPYGMFSFNFRDRIKSIWEILGKYDDQHKIFLNNIDVLLESGLESFKRRIKLDEPNFLKIMEDLRKVYRNNVSSSAADFIENSSCFHVEVSIKRCGNTYEVESLDASHPIARRDLFENFCDQTKSESDRKYMRRKIIDAELLVKAVNYRHSTLLKICREIAYRQIDYLMGESSFLLPIDAKSIAASLMCHPSTVHRAISNKYVDTPQGIILLKDLMPRGIHSSDLNQVATQKSVEDYIKKMIKNEPKNSPYSDEELSYFLASRGVKISRRTVAKYRKNLDIANSNERTSQQKNAILAKNQFF